MFTLPQRRWIAGGALLLTFVVSACVPMPAGQSPAISTPSDSAADSNPAAAPAESGAMATVTTRSLRVRAQPADSGNVVAGIKEGERYPVLGLSSDGGWVQLSIPDAPEGNGWVKANFVSIAGSISDVTTAPAVQSRAVSTGTVQSAATITRTIQPPAGYGVVATEGTRLRVRSEPTADGPIIGFIYDGEQYQILETSADGQWVKIPPSDKSPSDNPEGGWVAAQYLIIGQ